MRGETPLVKSINVLQWNLKENNNIIKLTLKEVVKKLEDSTDRVVVLKQRVESTESMVQVLEGHVKKMDAHLAEVKSLEAKSAGALVTLEGGIETLDNLRRGSHIRIMGI